MFLLLACSDYKLEGTGDTTPPFTDVTTTPTTPTEDTGTTPAVETCNGTDDDGDGSIDEDFPDTDADGVADCVDDTCELGTEPAGSVSLSEACTGTAVVTDPWTTTATNVWTGLSNNPGAGSIAQTPLVMQLTDDDADGDVDADDDVDIAFVAWDNSGSSSGGHLVVIDAATQTVHVDLPGYYYAGEIAAGDIDGDGVPELLGYDGINTLMATEVDGTELWSAGPLTNYIGGQPSVAIADLDGDGVAEVLAQEAILAGPTGDLLAAMPSRAFSYTQHVAADLDGDGTAEIVYDGDVHAADGSVLWQGISAGAAAMVHAMVLNVDGDAEGEVVMASDFALAVYDTDGTELATARWGAGFASVPCAADFDGDGTPEISVPAQFDLRVFELDGTAVATMPIEDTSTMAGCVGADLDGDGAAEIVLADEVAVYIFDARTETALVTYTEHASGTLVETPALADLDGDGAVEVLLTSNENMGRDTWIGLTIIEHDGAGWTAGPTDWPANARVEGRFDASGTVVDIGTWWDRENTFRSLGSSPSTVARDAAVDIDDVCVASCETDGVVLIAVQVYNPGQEDLPADTPVALYRVDGGVRTVVATATVGAIVDSGTSVASIVFSIGPADIGVEGFVATVGEGTADCHPEDNEAAWTDVTPCYADGS